MKKLIRSFGSKGRKFNSDQRGMETMQAVMLTAVGAIIAVGVVGLSTDAISEVWTLIKKLFGLDPPYSNTSLFTPEIYKGESVSYGSEGMLALYQRLIDGEEILTVS